MHIRTACAVLLLCGSIAPVAGSPIPPPGQTPAPAPAPPAATEVATRLQARYDTIRDFSADFVHNYEGGVLKRTLVEKGVVQIKKPGRMRWEYRTPQKKLFVSDGKDMYLHEVAANQVTIFAMPQGNQAPPAALFLAGRGNIQRDFTVSHGEGATADTYVLRLQPKSPERDYDWLVLTIDRTTYQIRSLSAVDSQGGRSTFQFSNFKENTGVGEQAFTFKIPKGAEVVRADSSR